MDQKTRLNTLWKYLEIYVRFDKHQLILSDMKLMTHHGNIIGLCLLLKNFVVATCKSVQMPHGAVVLVLLHYNIG